MRIALALTIVGSRLAVVLLGADPTGGLLRQGTDQETAWHRVDSGKPGPVVMIVGGLHGNEPAGARAAEQIGWLLGVHQDLLPFYALASQDATMAAVTNKFYGLHLPHTASVFEALVLGILGQQIATNVARIIRTLLIEAYGSRGLFDGIFEEKSIDGVPFFAFPRPEALAAAPVEELRGLKVSWRKAEYIQGVAAEFAGESGMERETLEGLEDEEVVKRVTLLRGVGPWTAQWLLIRALGRPDALPLGDLALRRVVSQLYFGGEPVDDAQVEEFCIPWSPWRSYATVYWFTALRRGMA